jgi:DNA-binding NarL/FixJ family response regulator
MSPPRDSKAPKDERNAARAGIEAEPLEVARRRRMADLYVLDASFHVVMSWTSGKPSDALGVFNPIEGALTPAVDRVVRQVTAELKGSEALALVPPSIILRIVELTGTAGLHYGVFAEAYKSRDSMREASRRYGISRRESEVLNLLVQGAATSEIAAQLHIAETTVQDHIKNIAAKTGARSRTEIVAKVLGPGT